MHHSRTTQTGAKVNRNRARLIISAFNFDYTYDTYPVLCGHAAIGNTEAMAIVKPFRPFSEDFVFAVRWSDGTHAFRYLLWEVDNNLLAWPVYDNETVPVGAYLEVWAHDSTGDNISYDASEIETSFLGSIPASSPCHGDQGISDYYLDFESIPELPADLSCNPFCDPLC